MCIKMKYFKDMSEEDRKKYFETLNIEPKKVESSKEKKEVHVIEKSEDKEKKEEKRRKKELEQYRETSGF